MVEYTIRTSDGTVIGVSGEAAQDTTSSSPQPQLVSVNDPSYPVLAGFNRALAAAEVGVEQTVIVPPADAYGERRRDQVKIITARKFGREIDNLAVGDEAEVNNKKCTIISIGSGRVRVDFNHKYAGKSIIYDFTILEHIESDNDKIHALLEAAGMIQDTPYGVDLDDDVISTNYQLNDSSLIVFIPSNMFRAEDIQSKKYILQTDLFKFIPTLNTVSFSERYINPLNQ